MDESNFDETQLVDRYLAEQLSEAEFDQFEERLLWDESLRAEVTAAERLRAGLQYMPIDAVAPPPSNVVPIGSRLKWQPGLAAAASFCLGIALTSAVIQRPSEAPAAPEAQAAQVFSLETNRSSSTGMVIAVQGQGITVLQVYNPVNSTPARASLRRLGAPQPIWKSTQLISSKTSDVAVAVPNQLLPEGQFVLTMTYETGDNVQVPFTVSN